jgi:hypothetical protein
MKKKIWFYLCIIQTVLLVCVISISLLSTFSTPKVNSANLEEYLEEVENLHYTPAEGYIPDVKTAKIIGSQIIDKMTGNSRFRLSGVTIDYDEKNRLWRINKGYFYDVYAFGSGGTVVIEQDSGTIIKAFMTK